MPRPKSKPELLNDSQENFDRLISQIDVLDAQVLTESGVCEHWSIKDILAHLHEWHNMYLTWYQVGMAGEKPEMPAPGFTWKTTPDLNTQIYEQYKDVPFGNILRKLKSSHEQVMKIIDNHSNEELFEKKRYKWTGSTSLGSYTVSCTSSHYDWATLLVKKYLKGKTQ